ncbi:MAG TPA: chorismate-binding protein [Thermoanaerobaculia bacterium]|nr:chorismate-binding protein [Thermoanaerobaculia bacterium]
MPAERDFAFIQTSPGRVFVGWGPFEQLPFRLPDRPAFFIADFFLDDPHPWRHPASWEEIGAADLAARFPATVMPRAEWDPLTLDSFENLFRSAQSAMERGDFKKIVPAIFENGRVFDRDALRGHLLAQLPALPSDLWAYGYSYQAHGVVGATPEVLFRSDGRGYATMALAGTRRPDRAAELLQDPKELREHRLVVDDIVRRLAPFGNVEVDTLRVLALPNIAHLATPIRFEESGDGERMSFAEMVRRLHPTAALGVSPRNEAGERWLREADRQVRRRTFGAPFGVELEDRSALALVAIRNVHWVADRIRIGSGAGLLPESRIDREFEELRQKREQVKSLFGLVGEETRRTAVS